MFLDRASALSYSEDNRILVMYLGLKYFIVVYNKKHLNYGTMAIKKKCNWMFKKILPNFG